MAEGESASVFISYSRSDRAHAELISNELRARGYEVFRDLDDILPTEEWRGRLENLITDADVVVFLLSPKSAASEICQWEVDLASRQSKKIAPIVVEDVMGSEIPPMLSRLNYIFATERDRFNNAVDSLCDAIGTDIEWIREHTRLTRLAVHFDQSDKPTDKMLSSAALAEAERWLADRPGGLPEPSSAVKDYIVSSREHQSKCGEYSKARHDALTNYIDPILSERISSLEAQILKMEEKWKDAGIRIADSEAAQVRDEARTLKNFGSSGGKWHPMSAEYIKNAGAHGDYAEVYQFPCCNAWAVLQNEGTPDQFRADGCEDDPET